MVLIKLTISLGCSYLAMIVLFVLKGRSASDVTRKFDLYLKERFVKSVIAMPMEKFDDFSTGGILDRYSRIRVVSETLSNVIISVILEGVSLVVSSVILINISVEMFRMISIIVVGYIITYLLSKKQLLRLNRVLMEKESVIMTKMKELISNIRAGEKIFLTGTSGSGKSSLAKVMSGLISPTSGKVYLGKVEINQAKMDEMSSSVCYLPQEAQIFGTTIKENILMGSNINDEMLFDEILTELGIDKILNKRSLTIDSKVSENGDNFSGGEKQRIALARAIMRDADVYIFDESTSHLDKEAEQTIMNYINGKLQHKTIVFISHNTCLYHNADKIIHLENGNIEMIGSHEYLMAESSSYKNLCCR